MTTKLPKLIPVSDLRQDAASVLEQVQKTDEVTVITQRGRAAAVLLSLKAYEQVEHQRQILLLLTQGEQEIAKGEGEDLEQVLAEAEALLAKPLPE